MTPMLKPHPKSLTHKGHILIVEYQHITFLPLHAWHKNGFEGHKRKTFSKLTGDPHSSVKGHVINGLFDSIIISTGVKYHIESASKFFTTADQDFHSIVYRAHDVHVPDSIRRVWSQRCMIFWIN